MKKKLLTSLIATLTFIPLLTGCNKGDFEITYNPYAEEAHIGQEYDFKNALEIVDGVNYKINAWYVNYNDIVDGFDGRYDLEVKNNFCFTPVAEFPINVEVEANRGGITKYSKYKLPVTAVGDPIDELLVTGGESGWADDGFNKKLNTNRALIKNEDSSSSIAVSFSGIEQHAFGKSVLSPNNFRCLDHWTDKDWKNTILTFWVYNPTEENIRFQLRLKDKYLNQADVDWGQAISIEQIALPNQWTQLFFSLHHFGIDHTLFVNEDGTRNDELNVKARWDGAPDIGKSFEYTFFVDGFDFVPNTVYPFIDTTNFNTSEAITDGLENLYIDAGMTSTTTKYDTTVFRADDTHHSTSSLKLDFKDGSSKAEYVHNKYAVTFSPQDSLKEGKIIEKYDFTHGLFEFDIKFNDYFSNHLIKLVLYRQNSASGWDNTSLIAGPQYEFSGEQTGWYHYCLDLATYAGLEPYDKDTTVRFEISFDSVDPRFEQFAFCYIDNITLDNNGGTQPSTEDIVHENNNFYNLENLPVDGGWSQSTSHYNYVNIHGDAHGNKRSVELDFSNATSDAHDFYFIAFDTSASECKDFQDGTLTADLYIPNKNLLVNDKVQLTLMNGKDWNPSRETVELTHPSDYPDNWYKVSFDYAHTNFKDVVRVAICFKGINEANKKSVTICIDNLTVEVGTPFVNPETIADGYENLNHDGGWESCKNKMTNEKIYTQSYQSKASMKVTFKDTEPNQHNGYAVILENKDQVPDLSFASGTLSGDIYYDGVTPNIKLLVTDGNWKTGRKCQLTLTKSNDWYHFSLDLASASFSDDAEFDPSKVINFGFMFTDVTKETRDNFTYYIDNIKKTNG